MANRELTPAAASERIPLKGDSMRTKKMIVWMFGIVVLLGASSAALAHHGTAAYVTSSMVTVKGTMTDFRYINPHVQLYFDVKNDKGEVDTLQPGDTITATGYVAKDGAHTMWIRALIGPHGEPLRLSDE